MDAPQLSALIAIAELGSIASAAESLGRTRRTVARHLEELESLVGCALLETDTRGSRLTAAGSRLVAQGRQILEEEARLRHGLGTAERDEDERWLAMPLGLPTPVFAELARAGQLAFPDLRFRVTVSEDPLVDLRAGADFALVFGPSKVAGPWRCITFLRLSMRLMATRAYLDAHGTPESLEALADHPLFFWSRPGDDGYSLPLRTGGRHPVTPWLSSHQQWQLRGAVEAGAGIGWFALGPLPKSAAPRPELIEVLPDLVEGPCPHQLYFAEGSMNFSLSKMITRMIRLTIRAFGG